MKKTLSLIALSVIGLGLVSCKKEAKETTGSEILTADSTAAPALDTLAAPVLEADSSATVASSKPSTTIALSESTFDFGTIKKGDKVEHVYEVTNTGKNPLVISAVTPGCGCTAGEFTKEPILPGKKDDSVMGKLFSNYHCAHQFSMPGFCVLQLHHYQFYIHLYEG